MLVKRSLMYEYKYIRLPSIQAYINFDFIVCFFPFGSTLQQLNPQSTNATAIVSLAFHFIVAPIMAFKYISIHGIIPPIFFRTVWIVYVYVCQPVFIPLLGVGLSMASLLWTVGRKSSPCATFPFVKIAIPGFWWSSSRWMSISGCPYCCA